jgi:hypothetical protein
MKSSSGSASGAPNESPSGHTSLKKAIQLTYNHEKYYFVPRLATYKNMVISAWQPILSCRYAKVTPPPPHVGQAAREVPADLLVIERYGVQVKSYVQVSHLSLYQDFISFMFKNKFRLSSGAKKWHLSTLRTGTVRYLIRNIRYRYFMTW